MWPPLNIYTNTLIAHIYKPMGSTRMFFNTTLKKIRFFANTVISPYSPLISPRIEILFSLFAKMIHICSSTSVVEAEWVWVEGGVLSATNLEEPSAFMSLETTPQ